MTSTSGLTLPTRSEAEARRDRARKNVRDAARADGLSERATEDAVAGLEGAYAMKDMMDGLFGGVK